jgi:cytochrome c biogenesis protein CcmG/thiol:disulfide interchange protein DsbE
MFIAFLGYALFMTRAPTALIGREAPDFDLPLLGGEGRISDEDVRGHPVVVNFWASWCIPCKEEAPTLESKWRKYRDRGVRFLGVNVQDAEQDALGFVEEFDITFPSVRDPDQVLWRKFGVRGIPETFFIQRTWRFAAVGSSEQIDSRGGIKVLGAIEPALLESQIHHLLEGKQESDRARIGSRG